MQKVNYSEKEIIEKLTNHCLFRWSLTLRTSNDYVKVAMMSFDDALEPLLRFREQEIELTTA